MRSTAPCPSLEDLAAFLDGGDELSAERRREIVEHLAACEECYEVFAGAAASLDEAPEVAAAPPPARGSPAPSAVPPPPPGGVVVLAPPGPTPPPRWGPGGLPSLRGGI